jgi:hypothetical protein
MNSKEAYKSVLLTVTINREFVPIIPKGVSHFL